MNSCINTLTEYQQLTYLIIVQQANGILLKAKCSNEIGYFYINFSKISRDMGQNNSMKRGNINENFSFWRSRVYRFTYSR